MPDELSTTAAVPSTAQMLVKPTTLARSRVTVPTETSILSAWMNGMRSGPGCRRSPARRRGVRARHLRGHVRDDAHDVAAPSLGGDGQAGDGNAEAQHAAGEDLVQRGLPGAWPPRSAPCPGSGRLRPHGHQRSTDPRSSRSTVFLLPERLGRSLGVRTTSACWARFSGSSRSHHHPSPLRRRHVRPWARVTGGAVQQARRKARARGSGGR